MLDYLFRVKRLRRRVVPRNLCKLSTKAGGTLRSVARSPRTWKKSSQIHHLLGQGATSVDGDEKAFRQELQAAETLKASRPQQLGGGSAWINSHHDRLRIVANQYNRTIPSGNFELSLEVELGPVRDGDSSQMTQGSRSKTSQNPNRWRSAGGQTSVRVFHHRVFQETFWIRSAVLERACKVTRTELFV